MTRAVLNLAAATRTLALIAVAILVALQMYLGDAVPDWCNVAPVETANHCAQATR